jgi:hypothetical protein
VLFRLWVRVKVVREPGWDDVFVLLAMVGHVISGRAQNSEADYLFLDVRDRIRHMCLYM